jgi:ribonuclease P protein component
MQSFQKKQRLLNAKEFKAVFQSAKKRTTPYLAVFSKTNNLGYARLGLIVAKRNVRYAHERNLIKRIIRESFRLNQSVLCEVDLVVIVYRAYNALSKKEKRQAIDGNWKKIPSGQTNTGISDTH